jgi:predicted nucleotidyltransferase/predicted transcriptional regulator
MSKMLLNTKILQEFVQNITQTYTGSFIAKKYNLNQKTVSNYLLNLEKQNFLQSKTEGKNKLYFLNLNNKELIKHFIVSVEHVRTMEYFKKNLLIQEISEKINPFIKGIALIFGSFAKNLQKKDSDLDLLIIGKCDEEEIEKISKLYNLEISLKIYPKFEKDILIKEALKNHISLKNTEKFVEELLNE